MKNKYKLSTKNQIIAGLLIGLFVIMLKGMFSSEPKNVNATIPGITPSEVTLSMEELGYPTQRNFEKGSGWVWLNHGQSLDGLEIRVNTSSKSSSNIENIRVQAYLNPSIRKSGRNISEALSVLTAFASLKYHGSNPELVVKWLEDNFSKNEATITVGSVKFTIYALPANSRRVLTLQAVN